MIDDIQRAVGAYRRLSPIGRRLFRQETGLETRPRRKRKQAAAKADKPARAPRRKAVADTAVAEVPAGLPS